MSWLPPRPAGSVACISSGDVSAERVRTLSFIGEVYGPDARTAVEELVSSATERDLASIVANDGCPIVEAWLHLVKRRRELFYAEGPPPLDLVS